MVEPKRLVILAGPHKSASTSVQEFFVRYATNRRKHRKLRAFAHWRWPVIVSPHYDRSLPQRKVLSRLVIFNETELRTDIYQTIAETWNRPDLQGVVLGTEELDRFGPTPYSHYDGMQVIRNIVRLLQVPSSQVEIVVNYRTPRQNHWISIWKQLTTYTQHYNDDPDDTNHHGTASARDPRKPQPYQQFICYDRRVWEYLDCVANPLGLVQELRRHGWNVTLIDMGGVDEQGLDIAHVSACNVLRIPCTDDGWVRGINHTVVQNVKQREMTEFTQQHLDDMEWLFRKRDCSYRSILEHDPGVRILYRHSLWNDCDDDKLYLPPFQQHTVHHDMPHRLRNTTLMLQLLQAPFACHRDHTGDSRQRSVSRSSSSSSSSSSPLSFHHDWIGHLQSKRKIHPEPVDDGTARQEFVWIQYLQMTVFILLFIMMGWRRRGTCHCCQSFLPSHPRRG